MEHLVLLHKCLTEVMDRGSNSVWEDLPPETLRLIANRLSDICDYIRFRGVCVSWRLAAGPRDIGPHLPWLVTATLNSNRTTTISFFKTNPTMHSFHTLEIPETQGKWVYGSSNHGWLLMIGSTSARSKTSSISLLNPITRSQIKLPRLSITVDYLNLEKGIVCSHPGSTKPSKLLVAIWTALQVLAFYRQGDKEWTIIRLQRPSTADIVYFKDKLHLVDRDGSLSVLEVESSTISPLIRIPLAENCCRSKLVEVGGELLLVARYLGFLVVYKLGSSSTGHLIWVSIGDMSAEKMGRDSASFSADWKGSVCAQASPDCKGYAMYFGNASFDNQDDPIMDVSIRELRAVTGAGIIPIEQSNYEAKERVGRQKNWWTFAPSWILPNLH